MAKFIEGAIKNPKKIAKCLSFAVSGTVAAIGAGVSAGAATAGLLTGAVAIPAGFAVGGAVVYAAGTKAAVGE